MTGPGGGDIHRPHKDDSVIPRLRKGKVLTGAQFGCLDGIPTLNVTQGCLFHCVYCYARGYRQAPKNGEVYLYVNLPNLVKEELLRKRNIPPWVILNTSSDCFQSHPDILNVTYEVIRTLFDHGVGVSFLTKGSIPHRFISLLKRCPNKVFAQIGIVSLSERYWRQYEPGTPSPVERLENIRRLSEIGILPEIRIDPMIPFLTDTESEAMALFGRLQAIGVKRVTLSYLHLRLAIRNQMMEELSALHRRMIDSCYTAQEYRVVGSSVKTKLLPAALRERGYYRIRKIAERFGIAASVCRCKNPDLKGDLCSSGRVSAALRKRVVARLPLFQC